MCPLSSVSNCPVETFICLGVKIFLAVWIIFVPVAVTNRLDKIIKLLKDKK